MLRTWFGKSAIRSCSLKSITCKQQPLSLNPSAQPDFYPDYDPVRAMEAVSAIMMLHVSHVTQYGEFEM